MDDRKVRKPLEDFIKALPKSLDLEKAIVFGSYAGNRANKDSDIDVILVSESFKRMSEDKRLDLLYKASRFIEPEIHPWGFTQKELDNADPQSTIGYAKTYGKTIWF